MKLLCTGCKRELIKNNGKLVTSECKVGKITHTGRLVLVCKCNSEEPTWLVLEAPAA